MNSSSITFLEQLGHGPAAIRITPPARDDRTPTHFIALIDISDSMSDNNKLVNVKHCTSLLLKFLTSQDKLSLVTFGEESQIRLNRLTMNDAGVPMAKDVLQSLRTDGCTNLSAGLASIRQILDEERTAGSPLKQGLLILTDGHANRGVSGADALQGIFTRLREAYPELTVSLIGYGTDHNADLLKKLAMDLRGGYSVVEGLESAALAMGESLGGMISCVAQNVVIQLPEGTITEKGASNYSVTSAGRLVIGDLYAGSDVFILVNIPPQTAGGTSAVSISGVSLPSLETFREEITDMRLQEGRCITTELTRLRYKCSDIFRRIREAVQSGASSQAAALRVEAEKFQELLADPLFDGHPVGQILRGEIPSLEEALRGLERGGAGSFLTTQLFQHEAYTSVLRGATLAVSSVDPAAAAAPRRRRGAQLNRRVQLRTPDASDEECACECDPVEPPMAPAAPRSRVSYMSPTMSRTSQAVAAEMAASATAATTDAHQQ